MAPSVCTRGLGSREEGASCFDFHSDCECPQLPSHRNHAWRTGGSPGGTGPLLGSRYGSWAATVGQILATCSVKESSYCFLFLSCLLWRGSYSHYCFLVFFWHLTKSILSFVSLLMSRAHTTGKVVQLGFGLGFSDPKALEDNQEAS